MRWSRTTEFDKPPKSLTAMWPKNLEHSIALHGPNAKPAPEPQLQFEALEQSALVDRELDIATAEITQPVDEPRTVTFVDATGNEKLYPPGSLHADKKTMRTWSAQILVKK